ncbi:Smr/MutS family protein [Ulvibacterium sp.]|uniref:Smr/MutS family protein n=1 Tax=Ulvibacterium sp. TaxID=2665914 RepID=UPI00262EF090|nr:Smr/MutS family protein [Ulvibacterium sp.]
MEDLAVGDVVEALDDTIRGVIVRIAPNEITIEDQDGFSYEYAPKELIKVSGRISVTNDEVAQVKAQKGPNTKTARKTPKPKERSAPKMEVDLHIDQLVKSSKGMANHEMLNLQIATAKRQLEFAIRKRIQKVVFIHGVGEGVLREELNYLFRRYENVRYYDADYQKYGLGATEVYILQNY